MWDQQLGRVGPSIVARVAEELAHIITPHSSRKRNQTTTSRPPRSRRDTHYNIPNQGIAPTSTQFPGGGNTHHNIHNQQFPHQHATASQHPLLTAAASWPPYHQPHLQLSPVYAAGATESFRTAQGSASGTEIPDHLPSSASLEQLLDLEAEDAGHWPLMVPPADVPHGDLEAVQLQRSGLASQMREPRYSALQTGWECAGAAHAASPVTDLQPASLSAAHRQSADVGSPEEMQQIHKLFQEDEVDAEGQTSRPSRY